MPPKIARSSSAQRIDQLRALARRLEDRLPVNTRTARSDCRTLALQIIELLDIEDRQSESDLPRSADKALSDRVRQATGACREASEQAELTRLFVMTESRERA